MQLHQNFLFANALNILNNISFCRLNIIFNIEIIVSFGALVEGCTVIEKKNLREKIVSDYKVMFRKSWVIT